MKEGDLVKYTNRQADFAYSQGKWSNHIFLILFKNQSNYGHHCICDVLDLKDSKKYKFYQSDLELI
jgi:hypothetical protein